MKTKQVVQLLEEIRQEAMGELDPGRATHLLQNLSALLGNVSSIWIAKEMEYNRYFAKISKEVEKITEARILAKASLEYQLKLEAEALLNTTNELINSLKYLVRYKTQEMRNSKYQA